MQSHGRCSRVDQGSPRRPSDDHPTLTTVLKSAQNRPVPPSRPRPHRRASRGRATTAATAPLALPLTLTVALLAGCAQHDDPVLGTVDDDDVLVVASFYPLAFVAQQVGGDDVTVHTLTPPGAEPHSLEVSPRQGREVAAADVVVTLGGFQPAVDEVVAARAPEHHVDAAALPEVAAHRTGTPADPAADGEHDHDHDGDHDDHDDHGHDDHGHDHGAADPHVWLDPTLLAAVAHAVGDALAEADPERAAGYAQRTADLTDRLTALDEDLADGLARCDHDVVVVPHEAFGYLTERYGLSQVGIAGLDPEVEPSPARIREIRAVIAEHGVTTLFLEPATAGALQTLAGDLGLATAVLDPLETQVDEDADYVDVMRANLAALRDGLGCR